MLARGWGGAGHSASVGAGVRVASAWFDNLAASLMHARAVHLVWTHSPEALAARRPVACPCLALACSTGFQLPNCLPSLRSTTTRCTEVEDRLRSAQAEAQAAGQGRAAAEASALRSRQDLQAAQEQLEVARRGRAEAGAEVAALQRQVAELEASAALYIAKEVRHRQRAASRRARCGHGC